MSEEEIIKRLYSIADELQIADDALMEKIAKKNINLDWFTDTRERTNIRNKILDLKNDILSKKVN